MESVQANTTLKKYTPTGDCKVVAKDDFGEPWYLYQDAPIGAFRKIKVNGGVAYENKDEHGNSYSMWSPGNPKDSYTQSINSTGIPSEYQYKSSKDFRCDIYQDQEIAANAVVKARNYVKEFKQLAYNGIGLYIYSPSTGSGKTFLSCLIASGLMNSYGESVKFVKSTILFEDLKRELNIASRENPQTNDKLNRLTQAPVLIIDDLGSEKVTDYISTKMYELISKRSDLHKVTIITSKKSIKELKYDTSTVAAINRTCRPIVLPNEDVATKLADEANKEIDKLLSQA